MNEQRCLYCQGKLEERYVNRLQEYQGQWILLENLPALVCTQCGEQYYTPQTHDFVVHLLQRQPQPTRLDTMRIYDVTQLVPDTNNLQSAIIAS